MRREIAVMSIALIAVVLIGVVIYPYLESLEQKAVEQAGGRKYIYTAVIKLKSPDQPNDPWYTGADGGNAYAYANLISPGGLNSFPLLLTTTLGNSPPSSWNAYSSFNIVADMDQVDTMTVRFTFSFSSNVFAKLYVVDSGATTWATLYTGVANTFNAGTSYRWTLIYSRYNNTNISVFPFSYIVDKTWYRYAPLTPICRYVDANLNVGETASGLTLSVQNSIVNSTHIRQYITITFDPTWNGLIVTQCRIYTADATLLNAVNSRANRTVSQLIIAQVNLPSIVVSTGDQVVLDVYAVAPTAVSLS